MLVVVSSRSVRCPSEGSATPQCSTVPALCTGTSIRTCKEHLDRGTHTQLDLWGDTVRVLFARGDEEAADNSLNCHNNAVVGKITNNTDFIYRVGNRTPVEGVQCKQTFPDFINVTKLEAFHQISYLLGGAAVEVFWSFLCRGVHL